MVGMLSRCLFVNWQSSCPKFERRPLAVGFSASRCVEWKRRLRSRNWYISLQLRISSRVQTQQGNTIHTHSGQSKFHASDKKTVLAFIHTDFVQISRLAWLPKGSLTASLLLPPRPDCPSLRAVHILNSEFARNLVTWLPSKAQPIA